MLIFPIKRKWFNKILAGEKPEEYRDDTPYYRSRLEKYVGHTITVCFRNGYSRLSPTIECQVKIRKGLGNPAWGAVPGKQYFIQEIKSVKDISLTQA